MRVKYRPVNRQDLTELRALAEIDSKIPAEFEPGFRWNKDSVQARLELFTTQLDANDFF